jgi:hypothetical protein
MKKLPILMFAATACLALASCSDDDDNGNNNVSDALKGTYELTSLTAPTSQDYDSDGDSNTNLVLEGNCYNESWISFHEDGTYDESITSSTSTDGGLTLDCDTQVSSGTYTQDGNTITTMRTEGEGSLTATYAFNSAIHTLTATSTGASYAGWNTLTSLFTEQVGNLQATFTKYSDNDENNGAGQNDDDNTDDNSFADLTGNFDMSAFVIGSAQDLDNDGDSSTNLMTESSCYTASNITFHNDGTYEEQTSSSILGAGGLSLDCHSETTTGMWTRNGDMVTTRHLSGATSISTQYAFDSATHVLTRTDDNGNYPGFTTGTSLYAMLTGAVDLTYIKDSE